MTDEEVICRWMEPQPNWSAKGRLPWSQKEWWAWIAVPPHGEWKPILAICREVEKLGRLHEVEARLSDEKRLAYIMALYPSYSSLKRETAWALLHATAAQKIAALAAVLRNDQQAPSI